MIVYELGQDTTGVWSSGMIGVHYLWLNQK